MGGAVSIKQENNLPPLMSRCEFERITNGKFEADAYDRFVDHDGYISKARLVDISTRNDCYISHDWGIDEQSRSTHDRVVKIADYIASKGLFPYLDNGQPLNGCTDYSQRISYSMSKAQCVIVCLTKRYYEKLVQSSPNSVKEEFTTALKTKGSRLMIPVLMETSANIANYSTAGDIFATFRAKYCVDMTDFEAHNVTTVGFKGKKVVNNKVCDDLCECIVKTVNPLKNGGDYKVQAVLQENTVEGRHYYWLNTRIPGFKHVKCLKYAQLITEAGVTTTSKLFGALQSNDGYLVSLGINAIDADLIRKQLHIDLTENMSEVNAIKVVDIIEKQNKAQRQRDKYIAQQQLLTADDTIKNYETVAMSIEDARSVDFREQYREWENQMKFSVIQYKLMMSTLEHNRELNQQLADTQHQWFEKNMSCIDEDRVREYKRITRITDGNEICIALRQLLRKIQKEIDVSISDPSYCEDDIVSFVLKANQQLYDSSKDDSSDFREVVDEYLLDNMHRDSPLLLTDGIADSRDSDDFKHSAHRVRTVSGTSGRSVSRPNSGAECNHTESQHRKISAYIAGSSNTTSRINSAKHANNHREVYNNTNDRSSLYNLLQESVYILHVIAVLCRNNPQSAKNVAQLASCSAIKLWTSLMSTIYMFNFTFHTPMSVNVPESFRTLSTPLAGLYAMKYLCRYNAYRNSTNMRNICMFAMGNTIQLCFEIAKFHINDREVVCAALECVLLMTDSVQNYRDHGAILMSDRNNMFLILMILDQYKHHEGHNELQTSIPALIQLRILSTILTLISLLLRTGQYNREMDVLHVQYIMPPVIDYVVKQCIEYLNVVITSRRSNSAVCEVPVNDEEFEYQQVFVRLLACLDCIFYDPSHSVDIHTTQDRLPPSSSKLLTQFVMQRLNHTQIIDFLSRLYECFREDNIMSQYVALTVGNVVYGNTANKIYCIRCGIVDHCVRLLRFNMDVMSSIDAHVVESRETVLVCLITVSNLIILQYDTTNTVQYTKSNITSRRPNCNKSPPVVRSLQERTVSIADTDIPSALITFLVEKQGMVELIMNIVSNYSDDRSLLRAALILCCKLAYKGLYITCYRLVSLGLCEKIMPLYKRDLHDSEMFFLYLQLFAGMTNSHPNLVGANRRLIKLGLCKTLTEGLRRNCTVTGERRWTHVNYPYTCRLCMDTCYCVYKLTRDIGGNEIVDKFRTAGFHAMLCKPPLLVCDELSLETLDLPPSQQQPQHHNQHHYSQASFECKVNEIRLLSPLNRHDDVSSSAVQIEKLFEKGNYNSNVEYVGNLCREEKDQVMSALFDVFHVDVFHIVS